MNLEQRDISSFLFMMLLQAITVCFLISDIVADTSIRYREYISGMVGKKGNPDLLGFSRHMTTDTDNKVIFIICRENLRRQGTRFSPTVALRCSRYMIEVSPTIGDEIRKHRAMLEEVRKFKLSKIETCNHIINEIERMGWGWGVLKKVL